MQVLVVGDNPTTAARHSQALHAAGLHPALLHPGNPSATLDHLAKLDAGVVVLSCPPGACTGACLTRQLRQLGSELLILVVAVRGAAGCWTGCHQAGADDYLEAAADLPALPARVKALQHRCRRASVTRETLRVGDLRLNRVTRIATRGTTTVELQRQPFLVLEFLMREAGQTCTRERLLQVLGYAPDSATNALEMNIKRLRHDLDDDFEIKVIHMVYGVGYKIAADSSNSASV